MTRREALRLIGAGGGLLGLGVAAGCGVQSGAMGGGMMGAATAGDMRSYMELFARHTEIRRTVEHIPGGVRTVTESAAPELVAQLQAHVASMYQHLDRSAEVSCMSNSLPNLFRSADRYRRRLAMTPHGVRGDRDLGRPTANRSHSCPRARGFRLRPRRNAGDDAEHDALTSKDER